MARAAFNVEEILKSAVADAMRKVAPLIQRQIAAFAAEELERNLALDGAPARRSPRRSRPRGEEMTKWVADRNARRVPKFVIDATGLDTKKKIVAKFGENAAFEKGKPLPKPAK
jgi:hypothetical protein